MKNAEEVDDICFMNSKIASAASDIEDSRYVLYLRLLRGEDKVDLLLSWFGGSEFRLHLLYRATEDGFTANDFHSKCDNHGPTISLVESSTLTD